MKVDWPAELAGTGVGLPSSVLTNADHVARLDTTDEWIVQRTGIRERRMAGPGESTLSLALDASRDAIRSAGISAADIDVVICATITPEHPLPSTACELQAELGCRPVQAFDLVAACSGFVYGLVTAAQQISSGLADTVLVVGADCMTRMADMEDRQSAILFGDGAGAAIVRRPASRRQRISAVRLGADGSRAMLIWVPAGGAREPASARTVNERLHAMRMKGRDVYKFAVVQLQELIQATAEDAGVSLSDVSLIVPHQSNLRIIESACEKLNLDADRVFINISRLGNTSAASVPIALHEAREAGRIRPGGRVMLVALGAGLTWASVMLEV
jgi:3-oxoacyl-[acyl-carrier-protein] synthase-3